MQREHGHLRAEGLSIRLFTAMAEKTRENPDDILAQSRQFIDRWRQGHPGPGGAAYYFNRWESLIGGPLYALLAFMVSPSQDARDMRQAAPFVYVLSNKERWEIHAQFFRRVAEDA